MSRNWKKILFKLYQILLSSSILVAGICLISQCLTIYQQGSRPFTPETVALAFSQIAIPVYLCTFLTVLGIFLKPLFPESRKKPEKNYAFLLSRLQSTTDLTLCPAPLRAEINRLRQDRLTFHYLGLGILGAGSILFLSYGADPAHYSDDINSSMIGAMCRLILTMAVPLLYGILIGRYNRHSIQKEINLLKSAPAEAKCDPRPNTEKAKNTQYLRWGILAAGLICLVIGILWDGTAAVLTKAINICTECIGLG